METAFQVRREQAPHQRGESEARFLADVLAGLGQTPKRLSSKYFYDAHGSRLFKQITALAEYYPTRVELGIMERDGREMAAALGPACTIVEYGSGAGRKTSALLSKLDRPAAYVPIEIDPTMLAESVAVLAQRFPALPIAAVCADYTRPYELPDAALLGRRRVVFFPGSTLGNFEPAEAQAFLAGARRIVGPRGALMLGIDLRKNPKRLHAAYNDRRGVTAAFNKNIMRRIKTTFDVAIDLDDLMHYAFYEPTHGRIEMHLVSLRGQRFSLAGRYIVLAAGETILTEYSYKYSEQQIVELATRAGFPQTRLWLDDERLFAVCLLE